MTPHGHRSRDGIEASLAVLTVSDTRTPDTDSSGRTVKRLLEQAGHHAFDYTILPDDPGPVRERTLDWLAEAGCHGVIVNGGTGISSRDRTYEALWPLLDKHLDGFGELFRMISFQEIGSAAMLSRAFGGVAGGKLLFSLPGSTAAVELAMQRLIVPELAHLLAELRK